MKPTYFILPNADRDDMACFVIDEIIATPTESGNELLQYVLFLSYIFWLCPMAVVLYDASLLLRRSQCQRVSTASAFCLGGAGQWASLVMMIVTI